MKQFLYALAWVGVTLFSFNLSTTPAQAESADATLAKSEYDSYIVLMEPAPAIQYEGDIKGYEATKPGKNKKVNPKSAHVRKYTKMLNRRHDEVLSRSGVSKHNYVGNYGNTTYYRTSPFNGEIFGGAPFEKTPEGEKANSFRDIQSPEMRRRRESSWSWKTCSLTSLGAWETFYRRTAG